MKLFNLFRMPTLGTMRADAIKAAEREAFNARRCAELYAVEAQRQTLSAEMLEARIATLQAQAHTPDATLRKTGMLSAHAAPYGKAIPHNSV